MLDLKRKTKELIEGSIITNNDGIDLYTPDGTGFYPALWTRDFAYMVEYAGDLMDKEKIKKCIEHLLGGADKNGWIPDRIEAKGKVWHTAGDESFPGLPNLDNGCFMVIAAGSFLDMLDLSESKELFKKWEDKLNKGIECLPVNEQGLIENKEEEAHSPYGFTDCIRKTGLLAMESLLLWRALKILQKYAHICVISERDYSQRIALIEKNFAKVFSDNSGIILAATGKCRQLDLWASCYAISIGFPLSKQQKDNISKWFTEHYDEVVENGQLRHLPKGEYWEALFTPVENETYQNGAYWAVPSGWLFETLLKYDKNMAHNQIKDVISYFEKYGVYECVNGEYKKLDSYVASATNVYYIVKNYPIYNSAKE